MNHLAAQTLIFLHLLLSAIIWTQKIATAFKCSNTAPLCFRQWSGNKRLPPLSIAQSLHCWPTGLYTRCFMSLSVSAASAAIKTWTPIMIVLCLLKPCLPCIIVISKYCERFFSKSPCWVCHLNHKCVKLSTISQIEICHEKYVRQRHEHRM